jgi:nucleotide-binding universal stress UspA family protein
VKFAANTAMAVLPELQSLVEEGGREQLKALITAEDRTLLQATPVVVTSVATAEAIVDYARVQRIDLIVLGTHGRGTIGRLLVGSVAERVVRTAPCPVLTVRQPERDCVVPDALVAVASA